MTAYAALALCFVGVAAAAAIVLARSSRRRGVGPGTVTATVLVLFALTAVFDNVMIASGLFHYDAAHLLGPRIGLAPVEDFAYPLAGALLLPALWVRLHGRRTRPGDERA